MKAETIILGGGCFWCTEAVFKMLKGITSVEPGYSGGKTENPTYEQVCSDKTGHVEVVKIEYDSEIISLDKILTVFFSSHDPTSINRQGNDVGEQYKSVVFYTNKEQKEITENFIKDLNASSEKGKLIVTTVEPFDKFYPAEDYHKDYYKNHKNQAYCQVIINPKLEKVQKNFAELLNNI